MTEAKDASCPSCGSVAVRGQLMPTGNVGGGLATVMGTSDVAAGVLVADGGTLAVHAFCLVCGHAWLPVQQYLADAVKGKHGTEAQAKARAELKAVVSRGSGFKLVGEHEARMAEWARDLLANSGPNP